MTQNKVCEECTDQREKFCKHGKAIGLSFPDIPSDLIQLVGELLQSIQPDGSTDDGASLTIMGNVDVSVLKQLEKIIGIPGHFSQENFEDGYKIPKRPPDYELWKIFHEIWGTAKDSDNLYDKQLWIKLQQLIEAALPQYQVDSIEDASIAIDQINSLLSAVNAFKNVNPTHKLAVYSERIPRRGHQLCQRLHECWLRLKRLNPSSET